MRNKGVFLNYKSSTRFINEVQSKNIERNGTKTLIESGVNYLVDVGSPM